MSGEERAECSETIAMFIEIEQLYGGALHRWLTARTRGSQYESDAQDLAQDTLFGMWMLLRAGRHCHLQSESEEQRKWIRAMLFRMARFRLIRLRSQGRKHPLTNVDSLDRDPGMFVDHVVRRMTVEEALECCSPSGRETLVLQAEGYSDAEIAERCHVREECIRSRRRRARRCIRRMLDA